MGLPIILYLREAPKSTPDSEQTPERAAGRENYWFAKPLGATEVVGLQAWAEDHAAFLARTWCEAVGWVEQGTMKA